jgi:hypothetical protein
MLEFEHVTALRGVNHYRNVPGPSANTFDRDVIANPRATEVNQAWAGIRLPGEIPFKVVYHRYTPRKGSTGAYGNELDLMASRKFSSHSTGLVKYACFDGKSGGNDLHKFWTQIEFAF